MNLTKKLFILFLFIFATASQVHSQSLVSPPNGALNVSQPIELKWTINPMYFSYQVVVATSPGFKFDLVFTEPNAPGTAIELPALISGTTYYWRVRGHILDTYGTWSVIWSFTAGTYVGDVNVIDRTVPVQNAINQSPRAELGVLFLQDMWGVNASSFVVQGNLSGKAIGEYSITSNSADFKHDDFSAGEIVSATLTDAITTSAGVTPTDLPHVWQYTVGATGGTGIFEKPIPYDTNNAGKYACGADFNGDGLIDVAAIGHRGECAILINRGNGVFGEPIPLPLGGFGEVVAINTGDFDLNGTIDLVLIYATGGSSELETYLNDGSGKFEFYNAAECHSTTLLLCNGDFDGDGDLDLVAARTPVNAVAFYENMGKGNFELVIPTFKVGYEPTSIITADLNNDGQLDIVTANSGNGDLSILLNNSRSALETFSFIATEPVPVDGMPISVCAADFNGDGHLDLATTDNMDNFVSVFVNRGDAVFAETGQYYKVGEGPTFIISADFDGDGDLDLATANERSSDVSILINEGDALFIEGVNYRVEAGPITVFSADFDSDGDMDLLTANNASSDISILLNINNLNQPPVITCPADAEVECGFPNDPSVTGTATATDDGGTPTISFSDGGGPGICPATDTLIRTWTATDNFGLTSKCYQTITIIDKTSPAFTSWAPDLTVDCGASTEPGATGSPTAEDGCDGAITPTHSDNRVGNVITRTWMAIDACGNSTSANQIITIAENDTTPPLVTCPSDIEVPNEPGTCGASVSFLIGASDNCGQVTVVSVPKSGSDFAIGTTVVKATATDGVGLTSECEFNVTIIDADPPSITCPKDAFIYCGDDINDLLITGAATATDLCDPEVDVTYLDADAVDGVVTRAWTATDDAGNTATCDQLITLASKNRAPTVSCPTANPSTDECSLSEKTIAGFEWGDLDGNLIIDSVAAMVTNGQNSWDASVAEVLGFPGIGTVTFTPKDGLNTITFTATDDCGATAVCQTTVTVNLNSAPVATCPPNKPSDLYVNQSEKITVSGFRCEDSDGNLTSCRVNGGDLSGDSYTFTPVAGDNKITLIAADGCGVTASCNYNVSVKILTGISFDIQDTTLFIDEFLSLTVTGALSGGTSEDVTSDCGLENNANITLAGGNANFTSTEAGTFTVSASLAGFTDQIVITVAPSISPPKDFSSGSSAPTDGSDFSLNVSISGSPEDVYLLYRRGGEILWDTIVMVAGKGDFGGDIPSDIFDLRGVEFYFEAVDNNIKSELFDNNPLMAGQPFRITTGLTDEPAPEHPGGVWQMVGFPFDLASDGSISSVFENSLGVAGTTNWQIGRWNSATESYDIDNNLGNLSRNSGYWLWVRTNKTFSASGTSAIPDIVIDGRSYAEIRLEPGWNQISTPYAFQMLWNDRVENSDIEPQLHGYYSAGNNYQITNIMKPFVGYWVKNNSSGATNLHLAYAEFAGGMAGQKLAENNRPGSWQINLHLKTTDAADNTNIIGFRDDAEAGIDKYDFSEPPPFDKYLSMAFMHEKPNGQIELLGGDYRNANEGPWTYDILVRGNTGKPALLSLAEPGQLSEDRLLILEDPSNNRYYELNYNQPLTLPHIPTEDGIKYRLIIGSREYIDQLDLVQSTMPDRFTLFQNFPNPFNPTTSIRFALPTPQKVTIDVINTLGRRVAVLANDNFTAGEHIIVWNGLDENGRPAASGIYFYRLYSTNYSDSRKMILLK